MAITFIQNAALLITLSVLYALIKWYRPKKEFYFQALTGLWFGLVAVAAMIMPFEYMPGAIYDGRSVILTLAGLFGGGITALVSVIIAGVFRIYLGGSGILAGVTTIVFCSLTGLVFRRVFNRRTDKIKILVFWGIGIITHLVMLVSQLLLPWPEAFRVINKIWVPVMAVFPLTFVFIAKLIQLVNRFVENEQKIREAEALYRTTLLSIGDAVIVAGISGNIIKLNAVAEELTGWTVDEAKGKKLSDVFKIVNEYTRRVVEDPVTKVLKNGQVVGLANHTLLISKDGKELPIADSAAPVLNEEGTLTGVVLVFRDQTEEREHQKKLTQSEAKFRQLVESTDAVAWEYNIAEDRWTYVAPQVTKILGWLPDEWTNLNFWTNNIHPDEREKSFRYYMASTKNGENPSLEYRFKSKTGKYVWIRDVVVVEMDNNNSPLKLRGIMIDMTEQKNSQIRLKESEERFRKAILMAPIPIMVHDEDGHVINLSEGWTHFSGYTLADIPTLNEWTEKAYGENAEKMENYISGLFNEEKTVPSGDFEITTKTGEKRIWNFYTTPLGKLSSGKKIMLSMAPDITEKRRLFDELVTAKEKAEESERLKSAFLANMSHEIRTPLNGILGFTNLLTDDDGLSKTKKQEFAFIINKSAEGLLKIINDILDISKLETGKTVIEQKPFDAGEMLSTVHSIFLKKLADSGKPQVELKMMRPEKQVILNTDENRLMQVFSNLLDNAIRFTPRGSVSFGITGKDKNEVEVFVSDTGIGIEKEKQQLIFERFSQADDSSTRSYGGTGLGLAISKKLVELMGGEITLESEPGKGTTFRFYLPSTSVNPSAEVKRGEGTTEPSTRETIRILVVEDDAASSHFIRQVLKKHFNRLLFAGTGKEALHLFENHKPEIILMDIGLPDMSGLEIVRKIRERDKNVYIIAQTAYAMADDERRAIEAGCNDYIAKPLKTELLFQKLNKASGPDISRV